MQFIRIMIEILFVSLIKVVFERETPRRILVIFCCDQFSPVVSKPSSVDTCQSRVRAPSKAPVVSLSKTFYSHCLVLVGSRNGFERDLHEKKCACFTIELK